MKTIHLVLKFKWYDLIESGQKNEEYRDITPYFKKLFCKQRDLPCIHAISENPLPCYNNDCSVRIPTDIDRVCLHRGYTNTTLTKNVERIRIGRGFKHLGAPDRAVFILELTD